MADQDIARRVTEQLWESGIELAGPTGGLKTRYARAANMPTEPGSIMFLDVRHPAPAPPRRYCRAEPLLDLAGYGTTGTDGSVRFDIREYMCFEGPVDLEEDQIWVVATPRSSEPVYLTHLVQVAEDPPGPLPPSTDIQVRIFAWDSAGQPKAGAFFTSRALLYSQALVE